MFMKADADLKKPAISKHARNFRFNQRVYKKLLYHFDTVDNIIHVKTNVETLGLFYKKKKKKKGRCAVELQRIKRGTFNEKLKSTIRVTRSTAAATGVEDQHN